MSRTAVQIACTNPVALSHPWPEALGSISSQAALDNVHCADPPTSVVLCARMSQDFVRAKISAEDVRSEGKHMWLLHSGTHRSKHVFQLAMVIIVQASTCSEEWLCNRNTRKGIQVAAQAVRRSPQPGGTCGLQAAYLCCRFVRVNNVGCCLLSLIAMFLYHTSSLDRAMIWVIS